ncbi:MAG TPA: hypothetical protein VL400_21185 [Polyangiaceae bacterium]|jgi:hypothetical protein|nr:hypothetical protein [Polyangiaceae bacterium]
MKTLGRVLLASALALLPASNALAAKVKGKVVNTQDLLNPVWNEAKEPGAHRYTFREPSPSVPPDVRILRGHLPKELCIVALADKGDAPKQPIRIKIEGGRTSFVTLVVAPGQEIKFENHDPTQHAIYEVSGKGGLPEGTMAPDGTRTWTPPGPGKYELRDKLAPSLRSWVVVDPGVVKASFPNRAGDFTMELAPGNYTLQAFFSGEKVGEALPVEVKPAPEEQPLKDPLKAGADKKKDDDKKDDKDKDKKDEKNGDKKDAKAGG